jgi:hypothetical protein
MQLAAGWDIGQAAIALNPGSTGDEPAEAFGRNAAFIHANFLSRITQYP